MRKYHYGIKKEIEELIFINKNRIFCIQDIHKDLGCQYKIKAISQVIRRFFYSNKLIRTPTQLANGYYYTANNRKGLLKLYKRHILKYNFDNKEKLISKLTKMKFAPLIKSDKSFREHLKNNSFVLKYGFNYCNRSEVLEFLASLVGFCMCDAHVRKNGQQVQFFFRYEQDGKKFLSNFKSFFPDEYLGFKFHGFCYRAWICSKPFTNLLVSLGAPKGNKVNQEFLVPDWILYGPSNVKQAFLKTVIGNEGSAPSNNRWRIQFVLSKKKEYIENLINFQNQIRQMLFNISITTSHIQLRKQKGRAYHGRFYIKGKENIHKFYNLLEFSYAAEKQEVLESLIKEDITSGNATV